MLKLIKKTEQVHVVMVNDQSVTFTVRPAAIGDMDLAYVTALDETGKLDLEATAKDQLFSLKAGRSLLLQRITSWDGVWLSETEAAPLTVDNLQAFFTQYPTAFRDLSDCIRKADEDAEKN